MKISKKEYRDKQNQATGQLLVCILALIMSSVNLYKYFFQDEKLKWSVFVWVVIAIASFIVWRWREKRLKNFEVEEK
ncbi:hypothetical protein [Ekhidna sp.]|uniref:hypothetical protein n=1 Tax=Ekhidna sp. TaxID=2608089 RepID=UPI0035189C93